MLQNKIKTKRLNIKGKKGFAFFPAVSLIIFAIKLYNISDNNCGLLGINFFSLVQSKSKAIIKTPLIVIKRLALVKDKFTPEISISGPIV